MNKETHSIDIAAYPEIPFEYAAYLKSRGIKTNLDYLEAFDAVKAREELSRTSGIPLKRLSELLMLCELSRSRGLDGDQARAFYRKQQKP